MNTYIICFAQYEVDSQARPNSTPPSRRSRTDRSGTEEVVDRVVELESQM
jgi:hypothetical protein